MSISGPLIFIPGILGSRLCDRAEKVVWGHRGSLRKFSELALPFEFSPDQLQHRPCGLVDQIQMVGPWRLHRYDHLINNLIGLGYEVGKSLFPFTYDWRLSNFHTANLLKHFVDRTLTDQSQQVDIIAHSMGGLVARIYVQELSRADRVRSLTMMGTPHRGAGQVFRIAEEGWSWWQNAMAGGLTAIREAMLSFPSIYQLLPSYQNACGWRESPDAPVEDQFSSFDERAWARFDWLPENFKSSEGRGFIRRNLAEAKRLAELMDADIPSTVRCANIVSGLIDTRWKSFFHPETGAFVGHMTRAGDGTVIEWSAANSSPSEARGAEEQHETIFAGPVARQTIAWLLGDDAEPTKGNTSGNRGVLRDTAEQSFDIINIAFQVEPSLLRPGEQGSVIIQLTGDDALADANFSNIRVTLDDEPLTVMEAAAMSSSAQRTLSACFTAPGVDGAHLITIDITGLARFYEYIVVLSPV
jgi:pimeloyl-ACP methyl ester carboxylesterase